jgi:hypothetical protein
MRAPVSAALLVAALLAGPATAGAQGIGHTGNTDQVTYELRLRDGSRLYGTIEQATEDAVTLRTVTDLVVTASRPDIVSLRPVTGFVRDGEFLPEDPNRTRLFFAPTGRALSRGQTYFGTFQIMMPFVQVGVTDRFSIGGGTPLFFGLDESERPFWITPKLQLVDRGRVQAAAGVFHVVGLSGESAGIAYGVLTSSATSGSMTVGAGMAYSSDGGRSPIVMIGGDGRISRSVKVITENYFFDGGHIISGGFRFIGDRLSADVGLAVPIGEGVIAFPIVNFVYVF